MAVEKVAGPQNYATLGGGSMALGGGAMTPPIVAPNVPPMPYQPPFNPTNPGTFTGTAPTPTPYGTFTAPDPSKMAEDPYYQFRLSQGLKTQQRGAAARGTLLTGGFQKALTGFGQGLASEEGDKIYGRALSDYTTNRDTNAQNFVQSLGSYNAGLGAFNANTNATLGYGNLARGASNDAYGQARDAYHDARDQADVQASVTNANRANEHSDALDIYAEQQRQMRENALQPRQQTSPYLNRPMPGRSLPLSAFGGR